MTFNLRSRAVVEFVGTAFLLMAVVGSGIMAERLAGGNAALALLANSLATGAALVGLILALAPISGAHLRTRWSRSPTPCKAASRGTKCPPTLLLKSSVLLAE
jgi:hypothetical protein